MRTTWTNKIVSASFLAGAVSLGFGLGLKYNLSQSAPSVAAETAGTPPTHLEETLYTSDCRFSGQGTQSYGLPKDASLDSLTVVPGDFDGDGDLDTRVAYFRARSKGFGVEKQIVMFTCYNTTPQRGTLPAEAVPERSR